MSKFSLFNNMESMTESDAFTGYDRVILNVDDNTYYRSPNVSDSVWDSMTGSVLEATCPYATQDIADSVLLSIKGYEYRPYEITGSFIDLIADIGDGINANGLYSDIITLNTNFTKVPSTDLSAPDSSETNHEYPYEDSTVKQINRKIANTNSSITQTADSIKLEVSQNYVNNETIKNYSTTSEVSTAIDLAIDGITLSVVNGDKSSTFSLKSGETVLSSGTIQMTGIVTFTDLSTSGSTTINGSNITTGTISASRLSLTDSISWNDLSSSCQSTISDMTDETIAKSIMNGTCSGTFINGTSIYSPKIYANTFNVYPQNSATVGNQSYINFYGADGTSIGTLAGRLNVYLDTSDPTYLNLPSFKIDAPSGNLKIGVNDTRFINIGRYTSSTSMSYTYIYGLVELENSVHFYGSAIFSSKVDFSSATISGLDNISVGYATSAGSSSTATSSTYTTYLGTSTGNKAYWSSSCLIPNESGSLILGSSYHRWSTIYLSTEPNVSSDLSIKENINYDFTKLDKLFDKLKPVTYNLIADKVEDGKNKDAHIGLIANEVEESLNELELTNSDFSALEIYEDENGTKHRSLRYGEFTSLNIWEIQQLKKRVAELESKIGV